MVRGCVWALLAATMLVACQRQAPESEVVVAALTASTATITVSVPPNVDVGGCVVAASGSLTLADRVVTTAPICNVGTTTTTVGVDARVRDVFTRARLTTRDRALVAGRVDTTQSIQAAPSSTIVGPVNTQASFTPLGTETRTITFPSAADVDVVLQPDQVGSRDPGRYRNLTLMPRARLQLRTGTYYFETLGVIEPQAVLALDERSGPVIIYVKQSFTFRGSVESNVGHPDWIIGVTGTGTVNIEAPFRGTILAPGTRIVLGTGEQTHSGAFYARDIDVQPGVQLQHRPSSDVRPGRKTCAVKDDLNQATLSSFWRTFDIATPTGSTTMNGQLRLTSGGAGLAGSKDAYRFVHQSTTGDLDAVVKVSSITPQAATAGIMLRSDLNATSPFVAVVVSGSGTVSFRSRAVTGQNAVIATATGATALPAFVRLSRDGQRVTGYRSADGLTWQSVGTVTLQLPDGIHVGVVGASGTTGTTSTASLRGFEMRFASDCDKCTTGGAP